MANELGIGMAGQPYQPQLSYGGQNYGSISPAYLSNSSGGNYFGLAEQIGGGLGGDVAASAGKGFLTGALSGIAGGPPGMLAGGIIGLVGQGIMGWLSYKEQEEAREEAEKRYKQQMAESTRRWNAEMEMQRERLKMDKSTFYNNIKTQREQMENYYDERNNQRYNQLYGNLMNMLNTSGLRNKYLETWGR